MGSNQQADVKTLISPRQLPVLALVASGNFASAPHNDARALVTHLSTVHGTLQAIYRQKRDLTLSGKAGEPQTVFVGPGMGLDTLHAARSWASTQVPTRLHPGGR